MAENEAVKSLSDLPEDIIHHIMTLLPTTPDVMAIGLSSKTLISVLHSFQLSSLDFCHPELGHSKREGFLNFMIGSITALVRSKTKTCPERFRLQAPLMLMDSDRRIGKAIGFAVRKGVKELDIDACVTYAESRWFFDEPRYPLPVQVIITYPSNSITTLNFTGLSLTDRLNELLLGCPQIETVNFASCIVPSNTRLSSNTLKNIHISHCSPHLKFTIEVDSPNIQNFLLARESYKRIQIRFSRQCSFLKVLSLENVAISEQWLEAYVAELVNLETLTLKECFDFENFKVSNHHTLRRIELIRCSILHSIEIGVLHLESFTAAHNISCRFRKLEFDMNACKHLKSLELRGYSLTQEFLERDISQMTSLESLILKNCFHLPITKISQPNVTRFELVNVSHDAIRDIHVDIPRVVSFMYEGHIIPLRVDCYEPLLEATMSAFSHWGDSGFKLKTWFEFFGHCKTATLVCGSYEDINFPRKFRKEFTAPLNSLKRLKLEIGCCSWSRISRHMVESLLWLYPDLEALCIEYTAIKERYRRYVINVPCHDPKLLTEFLVKNTDDHL